MTLTGADWQLLESIIVVLPKKKLKKVCKHTDATKKAIKQVRKGQAFIREWDPKVAYQTLQYLEKHVYKKNPAKMNQQRLICNYHVMINDLNRAIFDENYRGQYPPLTRESRIQIERNPLVQPGEGYRNIIDYYLDDGLMGAPRYAKLHEATIGEVLDEMAIMGQYSI
ncbi:hypothetical protein [uncultured Limosilactobacillus sp.]|uniref:hypothetical protein n=1 Tax=uncultured Limosilactobacillus sp. TaxID=2837629 RepID=UPI00259769A7|nr:hypothetical protein [uncultured Limosilactobacillus sp.]